MKIVLLNPSVTREKSSLGVQSLQGVRGDCNVGRIAPLAKPIRSSRSATVLAFVAKLKAMELDQDQPVLFTVPVN
jgi:hypothetical protein